MLVRPLRYYVVDAFTSRPFGGNPAAIVPLERWPADEWLQHVAAEMNLSETAYLVPTADGYHLRWFTPRVEVDLCGHATLATARVLAHLDKLADGSQVAFTTRSGVLHAGRHGSRFTLDFPTLAAEAFDPPPNLLTALGLQVVWAGHHRLFYLVEVASEAEIRALKPNMLQLAAASHIGVIVTAVSENPQFDFVSRFFAPAMGVDEDPVTGSAHCCLAHFWGHRLGKTSLSGFQASARGGIVDVELQGDRVQLGGDAVIVAKGELLVEPVAWAAT